MMFLEEVIVLRLFFLHIKAIAISEIERLKAESPIPRYR